VTCTCDDDDNDDDDDDDVMMMMMMMMMIMMMMMMMMMMITMTISTWEPGDRPPRGQPFLPSSVPCPSAGSCQTSHCPCTFS